MRKGGWIVVSALVLGFGSTPAHGQGAAALTSLSGVVVDKDGGVIPGASVVVKHNATGASLTVVTNNVGAYSLPALDPGTYTVSIALQGFKTAVVNDVRLLAATPQTIRTVLEIGQLSEEVVVEGKTALVRAETPTISSTVTSEFITSLPRQDRNALNFLVFLPGVETTGGARGSTVSGLPQNTINISIDGVSTSNNLQSTDGFFSMVVPRLDAIEEVTLTNATAGADSTGQGAVQIRFVTRQGTNQFVGSAYEYFRHSSLNTNTFFNRLAGLPRPQATGNSYGGRIGGPIVIPGLVDGRGKAFFFFNQEETYSPNETRRTRTVLKEDAAQGWFTYGTTSPRRVNVLQLAAANGQLASSDPTVQALLSAISTATKNTGTITSTSSNLTTDSYAFLSGTRSLTHNPTTRLDFNLGPKHRLTGSYYLQRFDTNPDTLNNADPTFPGFPASGYQGSYRTTGSITLRSTLSSNLVNEVRGGWQSSPVEFFADANPGMFANQGGFAVSLGFPVSPNNSNITNAHPGSSNGPQTRNTINWNIDNNVNWLRGNHSMSFGGSFTRVDNWLQNSTVVQGVNLGFNTTFDPAASLFSTTNFPGASSNDLNNARSLYAMLTGRVSSLPGTLRLNKEGTAYVYNGPILTGERMDEFGFFFQDSWRWTPTVTITAGLRYELQLPMVATKGTYTMSTVTDLCGQSGLGNGPLGRRCNMFNPGVLNNDGHVPIYSKYDPGNPGYNTDYNNFAPNVGISWRPNVQNGWLRRILGDPDTATISGGFTRSYNRERIDRFRSVFANNPGATKAGTRGTGSTNFPLVLPGESWPILLRQTSRLGPPSFDPTPAFPIEASFAAGNDIRVFDPDLEIPYADSWSIAIQRALSRDMAVELRYVGTENKIPWTSENWNVENIYENGLLDEFKLAQTNLHANVAAGRGGTFAYFGPGSGTSPLPIFLAHFSAVRPSQAGNASLYTSTQFTNSTWINDLDPYDPDPAAIAEELWTGSSQWRTNMLAAGLPSNFWVMNPLVDSAQVTRNLGGSKYHSIQVDVRRRLSRGLQVTGSYTYARLNELSSQDPHLPLFNIRDNNIPHAFKMLWNYEIPVGRGKRFGTDMHPVLNSVLGNWEFSGTGRVQVPTYRLENTKLVGMSFADAQKLFKQIRITADPLTGATTVWNMPQDVIDNTRRAYDTDPTSPTGFPAGETPTGRYFAPASGPDCIALYPGDCAPDMYFYGVWFAQFDFRLSKRFPFGRKGSFDVNIELENALTSTNFTQTLSPSSSANVFRITNQRSGAREGQLVFRVNF
jgi:hypothetical protein